MYEGKHRRMIKNVAIVMSTYNANKNLKKQLDSIFNQKEIKPIVVVRDDLSANNTVELLKKYAIDHPSYSIKIIEGKRNLGYALSFWTALKAAPKCEYYAFSDQDDIWKPRKLITLIKKMESDNDNSVPKLGYSKMLRCTPTLQPLREQVNILKPEQLSKGLVLTQTFNYGAATVINYNLKKLMIRAYPDDPKVPHDLWAGILGYWFGKIYYVDENTYYWIRYKTSVTGAGTKYSGIVFRIKRTMQKETYPNVAECLYDNYKDLLTDQDATFLQEIIHYKDSLKNKFKVLSDRRIKRTTLKGTIMLKLGLLNNWF